MRAELTVGDEATEIPSHNAVPSRALSLVELIKYFCQLLVRIVVSSSPRLSPKPLYVV